VGAYDLITLDEAKLALNIPTATTTFDTELAPVVTAVSRRIDDLCGPVVIRAIAETVYDGGTSQIFLADQPVAAVTSLTEYSSTTATTLTLETNLVKPASGYSVDYAGGIIHRRSGGYDSAFTAGRGNVVVVYTAGRYANTASVDAKFKEAAALYLRHIWTKSQGMAPSDDGGIPTFGVPNVVIDLLARERRAPVLA